MPVPREVVRVGGGVRPARLADVQPLGARRHRRLAGRTVRLVQERILKTKENTRVYLFIQLTVENQ